jgi:phosphoglycolate phosphatase-like HAD superfamily hydrolase
MKALALDFDGVISDSAPEAYCVAVRTFREEFPECRFTAETEDDAETFQRFLDIMPLGNRAEDFGVALAAIDSGTVLPDQAAYDAFYASLERPRLRAFHKRFYRVRHAFSESDPEGWVARIQPYPGIADWLHRRAGDVQLAVATAKDRHSVALLLERYGIGDLFGEGLIHDKETGVSKRAHIETIARQAACSASEVTFIDDKVNHLIDVAEIGARCLLAGWGYNGEREFEVARAAGFPILTLESLDQTLFGA